MARYLFLILFFVLVLDSNSFCIKKYEVLFSDYKGVFVSAFYKNESVYTDVFYKFDSSFSLGGCFSGIFNVPIYGYSGYVEEVVYFGNVDLYGSFNSRVFFDIPLGMIMKFSYGYILDYRKFLLSFDFYSLGNLGSNVKYFLDFRNVNFGFYMTKYIPFKFLSDPLEFDFKVFYKIESFKFLVGVSSGVDVEFFKFVPYLDLGISYFLYSNFEIGVNNTFRVGNLLNLELFFTLLVKDFYMKTKLGFDYVSGFSSGIEFFIGF